MNEINTINRIYAKSPEFAHLIKYNVEMELTKKSAMHFIPIMYIAFGADMATAEIKELPDRVTVKINLNDIHLKELSKSINAQIYSKCQHNN